MEPLSEPLFRLPKNVSGIAIGLERLFMSKEVFFINIVI